MKLNLTIPCYNEEEILEPNILKVYNFLRKNFSQDDWQIIISDNSSIDKTPAIAQKLAQKYPEISYLYVAQKGKGRAIRAGWENFSSQVYIFMDADLATDLKHLPELIRAISQQSYDIAIGSRLIPGACVNRPLMREIFSRGLSLILRILLKTNFQDSPCGFKAVNRRVIKELLPQVENQTWFFDTELLCLAQKNSYQIKEMPVHWSETWSKARLSKVKIFPVAKDYFQEICKLRRRFINSR